MIKQEIQHFAEGRPRKVMAGKLTKEGGDIRFQNRGFTDLQTDGFYPLLDHGSEGRLIQANFAPTVDRVSDKLVQVYHHILELRWTFEEKP